MNLLRCPFCSKRTQYLPSPCFVFTFVPKSTTVIGTLRISINLVSFTSKNFFPSFVLPLCLIPLSAKLISLFVIVLHKFLQSPHLHQPQYEARISRLRFRLFIRFTFRAKFFFIFLRIRTLSFVKQ